VLTNHSWGCSRSTIVGSSPSSMLDALTFQASSAAASDTE
jgi:hypothetical protein